MNELLNTLRTLTQILTAGIAIMAFSLVLYAMTFNLRNRVARSFAMILICIAIIFGGEALGSVALNLSEIEIWLKLQWVGLTFLPVAYLHFSDALLETTGRPSRGRRRMLIRLSYLVAAGFLLLLGANILVGKLMISKPAPYFQATGWTTIFTLFYLGGSIWAWVNFLRAYRRTRTKTSQRRMLYLLIGAVAPVIGSYPYMLYGSGIAGRHQILFWGTAALNNLLTGALLVIMAYAVAFFGISWPDRIVKSRLFRWLLRGPITASTALAASTIVRRIGETQGLPYNVAVPIFMVASILVMEHLITLFVPIWERFLFQGTERQDLEQLQLLQERLLTRKDLAQFLEAVLAATCDHLQSNDAFLALIEPAGVELSVVVGNLPALQEENISKGLLDVIRAGGVEGIFSWQNFWLVPLLSAPENAHTEVEMLGLLGVARRTSGRLDAAQYEALNALAERAALALQDRKIQQQVLTRLAALTPQVNLIQNLRAASRYNNSQMLTQQEDLPPSPELSQWVKEALLHFWGGPQLTNSPLIRLEVVRQAMKEHQNNPSNALRAILRQAIDRVRPDGDRRFTAEWILYNILEMKFMEGHKIREIAMRLAVSEADLYRKQRVAIQSVAEIILDMERQTKNGQETEPTTIEESDGI